jgi:hypothetical protein
MLPSAIACMILLQVLRGGLDLNQEIPELRLLHALPHELSGDAAVASGFREIASGRSSADYASKLASTGALVRSWTSAPDAIRRAFLVDIHRNG